MKDREARIAERIVAGHSYALARLSFEVEGWQPVNIDVLRDIRSVWFDYVDDEGNPREDGQFHISGYEQTPRHLTYQQEQEMKRRRRAPVTRIDGSIPEKSDVAAMTALGDMLKRKYKFVRVGRI
jgi:hypothetical protein